MSKRSYMLRYFLILNILRRKRACTFKEIKSYLEKEAGFYYNTDLVISKSTFDRDREDIKSLFSIEIDYDLKLAVYCISSHNDLEITQLLISAFNLYNSLNVPSDLSKIVNIQKQTNSGVENLYCIINAILNRYIIIFSYKKFRDEKPLILTLQPYIVKEFKGSWYLIGKENNEASIKFILLEMMHDLEITTQHYSYPNNIDVEAYFRDSYGKSRWENEIAEKVVLSFIAEQGKYIKTFPIHPSQTITKENLEEIVITLNLEPTDDFVFDLLAYGDSVTVISPKWLKDEVVGRLKRALKNYV